MKKFRTACIKKSHLGKEILFLIMSLKSLKSPSIIKILIVCNTEAVQLNYFGPKFSAFYSDSIVDESDDDETNGDSFPILGCSELASLSRSIS